MLRSRAAGVAVPGAMNRLAAIAARLMPEIVLLPVIRLIMPPAPIVSATAVALPANGF